MTDSSKQYFADVYGLFTLSWAWAGYDPDIITKAEGQELINDWITKNGWPTTHIQPAVPEGLTV